MNIKLFFVGLTSAAALIIPGIANAAPTPATSTATQTGKISVPGFSAAAGVAGSNNTVLEGNKKSSYQNDNAAVIGVTTFNGIAPVISVNAKPSSATASVDFKKISAGSAGKVELTGSTTSPYGMPSYGNPNPGPMTQQ